VLNKILTFLSIKWESVKERGKVEEEKWERGY